MLLNGLSLNNVKIQTRILSVINLLLETKGAEKEVACLLSQVRELVMRGLILTVFSAVMQFTEANCITAE